MTHYTHSNFIYLDTMLPVKGHNPMLAVGIFENAPDGSIKASITDMKVSALIKAGYSPKLTKQGNYIVIETTPGLATEAVQYTVESLVEVPAQATTALAEAKQIEEQLNEESKSKPQDILSAEEKNRRLTEYRMKLYLAAMHSLE